MVNKSITTKIIAVTILALSLIPTQPSKTQAQACFVTEKKGPVVIYEDAITSGWSNTGSWNTNINLQSAIDGRYGNYAAQVDFTATWSGVEFRDNIFVDTAKQPFIAFRIRKAESTGNIYITARRQNNTIGNWISLGLYLGPINNIPFEAGKWYSVRVPFADLGITAGTLVNGILFESASLSTAYFDELVLLDGLKLAFPLQYQGWTAYTAQITSVFDHTMRKPYESLNNPSVNNDLVTAWTGEKADGLFHSNDPTCRQKIGGAPFTLDTTGYFLGNYVGASSCTNTTYLSYDDHPGIDYPVGPNTPVHAAESGTIIASNEDGSFDCPPNGAPCTGFGRVRIRHANGYATWYLHLSKVALGMAVGVGVTKGTLIGYSGNTSPPSQPVGYHLHFQVNADDKLLGSTAIDPYGWHGTYRDPYRDDHQMVFNSRQWQ